MRIQSLMGLCIFSLSVAANVLLWRKVHTAHQALDTAHLTNLPPVVVITNRIISPEQQRFAKVTWQDLDDPSIRNLVANLRAVKCPEMTIRDIVTARLDEQMDEQIASLAGPDEFWSTAVQKERLQLEQREKVRELEREEEALVRELFGTDWNRDAYLAWVFDPYSEFFLGFLSRDKAISVQYDLQNLAQAAQTAFKGRDIPLKADDQELERLSRQLKSKLSPAEYTELNLRSLATSVHISGFPDVPLSGADARYIVTLYAKHLDFIDDYLRSSREGNELRKSAIAAAQEDIKNYLGPDRYVAFQRAQDLGFLWLHKVALDAGLSSDTARKMFDLKTEASRQTLAISQNDSLAPDVRSQQLNDLRNTYHASMTKLIGEDRLKDYAYAWGAWWDKLGEVPNGGSGQ